LLDAPSVVRVPGAAGGHQAESAQASPASQAEVAEPRQAEVLVCLALADRLDAAQFREEVAAQGEEPQALEGQEAVLEAEAADPEVAAVACPASACGS